jgi:hypothetical protein
MITDANGEADALAPFTKTNFMAFNQNSLGYYAISYYVL